MPDKVKPKQPKPSLTDYLKQVTKLKNEIAERRDALRDLQDEIGDVCEDSKESVGLLEAAIEILSKQL